MAQTDYNTGPNLTNHQNISGSRQPHSFSDPRKLQKRNPLEVNVNQQKGFEAVDPFASNNPYSKKIFFQKGLTLRNEQYEPASSFNWKLQTPPENGSKWTDVRFLWESIETIGNYQSETFEL